VLADTVRFVLADTACNLKSFGHSSVAHELPAARKPATKLYERITELTMPPVSPLLAFHAHQIQLSIELCLPSFASASLFRYLMSRFICCRQKRQGSI